jgi:8-oxo-dGTP diphosphatase
MTAFDAPKHIVAVSGLVRNAAGEVLLVRSPKRGWEMPGGQVEEGETLPDALMRETFEEAGVTVTVGALVGVYSSVKLPSKVIFGFLCEYVSGELATSDESLETAWVRENDVLLRITYPAIYDRMRDLLTFNGQVMYRAYITEPYSVLTELEI